MPQKEEDKCPELLLKDINAHLQVCKYRRVKCSSCEDVKMFGKEMEDHYAEVHSDRIAEQCEKCTGYWFLSEKKTGKHKCHLYILELIKVALGQGAFNRASDIVNAKYKAVQAKNKNKINEYEVDENGGTIYNLEEATIKLNDSAETLKTDKDNSRPDSEQRR